MLILSQDRRAIINLDKLKTIELDEFQNYRSIKIFRETAEVETGVCELYIGKYATEERAKEVLQEIFKVYRLNKMFECSDKIEQAQILQAILKENMQPFTYEMPEK